MRNWLAIGSNCLFVSVKFGPQRMVLLAAPLEQVNIHSTLRKQCARGYRLHHGTFERPQPSIANLVLVLGLYR